MPKAPEFDEVSTVMQHRFAPSSGPDRAFGVSVIAGPDVGKRMTLDGSEPSPVLIGQSPACDLRVSDPAVSRRHAALDWVDGRLRITDLGSRNGTFVDHVAIGVALVAGGEIVRMGETALRIETLATAPAAAPPLATSFGRMVGGSREVRSVYPLCERLAASTLAVLIEGETGTGKEVLAESIHERGPRASGPFVVFDCTATPAPLVESELFGHERGAFTGAIATRKGVFEQADGGTLLIDEIGDLDLALQPKLLRALERSEVRRVGGDRWLKVDVRILSATRRDLDREVQAGRFRDDLFHRLAVARIELPPLRRRRGDVALLARHFCKQLGGTDQDLRSDLLARWEDLPWPGNIRELRNAVARQLALGDGAVFHSQQQQVDAGNSAETAARDELVDRMIGQGLPLIQARRKLVEEFEQRYIARVLAQHGGNVVRAAAASGIARRYFQLLRARTK
jgi:transcriptional regulator with GAF, ATPase, and Fis domain